MPQSKGREGNGIPWLCGDARSPRGVLPAVRAACRTHLAAFAAETLVFGEVRCGVSVRACRDEELCAAVTGKGVLRILTTHRLFLG